MTFVREETWFGAVSMKKDTTRIGELYFFQFSNENGIR